MKHALAIAVGILAALLWVCFTSAQQKASIGDHHVPGTLQCWEDEAIILTPEGLICTPIDDN